MTRSLQVIVLSVGLATIGCGRSESESAATGAEPAAVPVAAPAAGQASLAGTAAPVAPPSGEVEFKSVRDLNQNPGAGEPQLRGGIVARSADWPASLYATFETPRGTAACTAALVGPTAMLTAAHCVPPNRIVRFSYEGHPKPYTATCTQHPRYTANPADASADFALCLVQPAFAAPTGFRYESINTTAMDKLLSGAVILTGYGCISNAVKESAVDGKYRYGFNTIDETSNSPSQDRGARFYAPSEKNNLFTADADNTANLCPGDSGGPLFLRTSGGAGNATSRTIVGVNSRVFYRDALGTQYGSSLISATGGPDFRAWATDWAQQNGKASVCGLSGALPNCRT